METELRIIDERLIKLARDIEFIKGILTTKEDDEGELSDWAKEKLAEARAIPLSNCISHEEVKKRIMQKCPGK